MKEFTDKVPYGWWEIFRSRCMSACGWTYDQWQNRVAGRTNLNNAEREVMRKVYKTLKKEQTV